MIIKKTESKELEQLVKKVINKTPMKKKYGLVDKDVTIIECYDSRTFFKCEDSEFTIRMWNIENINGGKQGRVQWTLFLDVPDEEGSHGEELSYGVSLVDYSEPQMEFRDYTCNINRTYNIGIMTHDFFYAEGSINDRFKEFLNSKYDGKTENYIKPYGSTGNDGKYITSFCFNIGVYSNKEHNKCINSISVDFMKDEDYIYSLYKSFNGCKTKDGYELLNNIIEFMDNNFKVVKTA